MNTFRFSPELFEFRSELLARLADEGYHWLSHFSSIDPLHDVYGLEVCGIADRADAVAILRILRSLFPTWQRGRLYHKDFGREPGWKAVLQRDPECEEDPWPRS
jgi:hypothetical protein